ncbi:hypothetical protein [Herminiimonas sp. CN]|uniref:hypothetical protein n=1 Tax=Herminiimonas sp. CN TaxID=1349818 RepID=UPI0004740022|nr:hypothetical protein [Herminiimonas sp. CN]
MDGPEGSDLLRLKAEQALRNKGAEPAASSSDIDVRRQLHELQVSQIELTLQNSELLELQQARREIELLLARYTDLYEFARSAISRWAATASYTKST